MKQRLPEGWDEERIRGIIDHYENQSEDEAVAEDEAAYSRPDSAMVEIPHELLPEVYRLLPGYEESR